MEFSIPKGTTAVQGIPIGRLNNHENRISALEANGGGGVEVPTGTVNGSNTVFTVVHTPKFINVDGLNRYSTIGYTYAGGTITIIDGAPPVSYIISHY